MLPHIKELLTGLSGKRFEELRGTFDDLSDLLI